VIETYARWLCYVGMAAMAVLMMGVTVVDVVFRWFGAGVPGAYELVTVGMRILIPLAMPYVFLIGGHVAVEMLVEHFPPRLRMAVTRAGALLATAVMVFMTVAVIKRAITVANSGEVTADLGLPVVYYWVPLIVGCALSVPAALYLVFRGPRAAGAAPSAE
jgi:TRAP-type C4-dicarboxylate transport system permease small subunit